MPKSRTGGKKKPAKPSSPNALRVAYCFERILEGWSAHDIFKVTSEADRKKAAREKLTEQEERLAWGVVERSVRRYFASARKQFEQVQALKREQALGTSLARREKIFTGAMDKGRYSTAMRVQDSIDRLNGLTGDFNPGGTANEKPTGIQLPSGDIVYL